jgi:hypothetical protein
VKIALLVLAVGGVLLGIVELILRKKYGLGTPPLYVADARTGYRLAPNQSLQRRGNRIEINQYSMRGGAIQSQPPPDTLRVLMLGDSIVNGGWWTDQAQILSQGVRDALISLEAGVFRQVEVLNASANSWGPRNQLGYVVRFGLFESQVVLLVLNTDDLFAIAPNSLELGRSPAYPTRRPPLALVEVAQRLQKRTPSPALQALYDQGGDRVAANLEAIRQLHLLVSQEQRRLLLALTPLRRELEKEGPRDYERVARHRLNRLAQDLAIPLLDFLPIFKQNGGKLNGGDSLYRDHIHLSPAGNRLVGQALAQFIAHHRQENAAPIEAARPDDLLSDLW